MGLHNARHITRNETLIALTANTIDLLAAGQDAGFFTMSLAAADTLTAFANSTRSEVLTLYHTNGNTTVQNNTSILTLDGKDVVGFNGLVQRFVNVGANVFAEISRNTADNFNWTKQIDPDDLIIRASSAAVRGTQEFTGSSGNNFEPAANYIEFGSVNIEYVHFSFQVPSNYAGRTLAVRGVFSGPNAGAGDFVVGARIGAYGDGDSFTDAIGGTVLQTTDTYQGANVVHAIEMGSGVVPNNFAAADVQMCGHIFRNAPAAGDTLAQPIRLFGVTFEVR